MKLKINSQRVLLRVKMQRDKMAGGRWAIIDQCTTRGRVLNSIISF
jgi:hypothetical protein